VNDGAALLAACRAAPEDDRPLLVYADWLQEQGDGLGELIQVSVQHGLKGSSALAARVRELEDALFPGAIRWRFRGGRPAGLGHADFFRGQERKYPQGSFYSWLCLHPDGLALDASSSSPDPADWWAERGRTDHEGRYTFDPWPLLAREPVPITIWSRQTWEDDSGPQSVRLDYKGVVEGERLLLEITSDRTGLDWNDVFSLVPAPGHDTRGG
jgi:uncharacterized protein (TIGR02996 family)